MRSVWARHAQSLGTTCQANGDITFEEATDYEAPKVASSNQGGGTNQSGSNTGGNNGGGGDNLGQN